MMQGTKRIASGALLYAVALWSFGCTGKAAPVPATLSVEADTVADEVVVEAAEQRGIDPAPVVEKKHETEDRVDELDVESQREFQRLFGPDPLGLSRNPENAGRYEIPLETNEKVDAWIDYFQNVIPERFGLYLTRAGRYEEMTRRKLRVAGLPQDLLYLALIESGMNANAYSRARAVGMWQFIRGTARLYGLEVSYWVDERRDPEKATDAAIAFLSDLYDEFGSWYLAAAAYNGGPGRIRRGIARTGSTDFWELADRRTLRRETRNYVPKLLAAAIIARDPARHGFGDIRRESPQEYDLVEVPDATSFDVLADAAGTDEARIAALNPQYLRRVTPPDREVTLRVPKGAGLQFAANYAKIPAEERVTWLEHTVTRGQTLSHIAARYGTSVEAIRAANGNVHPRRLQIGQRLIVPRSSAVALAARTGGATARTSSGSRSEGPLRVTVRRGDTLWSIARQYAVSTTQLMRWNNLSSTLIKPGDQLEIRPAGR